MIGAGTSIEGNVNFSGGLRVDGHVRGNVAANGDTPSTLVLSEQARIEGEIRVSHVVINGSVIGPVHAGEYCELQSKCNVTGDVYYKILEIQLGAVVQGRLVFQDSENADKVLVFKPATAD
ncbi:MAG: bactofilin family protein [Burkholderiales bacterium]